MATIGGTERKLLFWAHDPNPKKRWLAVRHPECPWWLAFPLLDDPHPQVRLGALCRLVLCGEISVEKARQKARRLPGWGEQFDAVLGLFSNLKRKAASGASRPGGCFFDYGPPPGRPTGAGKEKGDGWCSPGWFPEKTPGSGPST